MMNIPADVAGKAVDALRSTPVILALILMNVIMLSGFWYTLHSVASAMERRDSMIKACIEKDRSESTFRGPRLQSDESRPFALPPLPELPTAAESPSY
jgi:hypothetical protein